MIDYSEFPPIDIFKKILRQEPQAALVFAFLHKMKPTEATQLFIKRNDVKKKFLVSPTLFRNHLLALARAELVTFEETQEVFVIDFYE